AVFFVPDQTVRFQLRSSNNFQKVLITAIADSTISFHNNKIGNLTFKYKDLKAFKIPRSGGRKAASYFLMAVGGVVTVAAVVAQSEGGQENYAGLALFGSVP